MFPRCIGSPNSPSETLDRKNPEMSESPRGIDTGIRRFCLMSRCLFSEFGLNVRVKKSLESYYPEPETPSFRPIQGFAATASSKNLFQAELIVSDLAERAGISKPH
jgi:hypothetical protein